MHIARRLSFGATVLGVTAFGLVPAASADSLVVNVSPGVAQNTDGITNIATDGADMVGMLVTAVFDNGSSESRSWEATSASGGEVAGTGWSLRETGDTFGGDWTLTNVSAAAIARIRIDGAPGRTVFDVLSGTGTPNSASGQQFTRVSGGTNRDIAVSYSDAVGVGGNPPAGDLFRRMEVNFNLPGGPITAGSPALVFETDTDSTTGDIIPEPAAGALALAALAGCSLRRGRARVA